MVQKLTKYARKENGGNRSEIGLKEYKHLKYAMSMFSADWEESEEGYTTTYTDFISREEAYAASIKKELEEALQDPEWSWVKKASEHNFIGSDDSEQNVLTTVKELILQPILDLEKA